MAKQKKVKRSLGVGLVILVCMGIGAYFIINPMVQKLKNRMSPEEVLRTYTDYINQQKYEEMYDLLNEESQVFINKEDFISKNQKIYEGIEVKNLNIAINEVTEVDKNSVLIDYDTKMDTLGGKVTFDNQVLLTRNKKKEYKLRWYHQLIFPALNPDDRVRVNTLKAERGGIFDRNGELLAGEGYVSSVGIVPGKLGANKEEDLKKVGELLEISEEGIHKKLGASYVKADTFVPLKKISADETELEQALLEIQGIKITNTPARVYPYEEKTSHLVGYIQNVNAEDLERLKGKGYNSNSIIGKSGLEKLYEEQLRGIDGCEIVIVDSENNIKETLAKKNPRHGKDITLTIDIKMQSMLYDQFAEDKSSSVAMNPKTGEVLALVSTPSFDSNDFVIGMSTAKWDQLNNDPRNPLYNRFRSVLVPGSGFKSIIGAIGLTTGKVRPDDNYGNSGLSWQKDSSWGGYKITTLKDYGSEVVLRNALIYSDNIYFAKAALNIGPELLAQELKKLGFEEQVPFEIGLSTSTFSNTGAFDSEIQLADSGYGQAQVLMNPVHMASIYSAFVNEGNMIKPYLMYRAIPEPTYWKEQVFTKEASETIKEDLIHVVEKAGGGIAKVEGMTLAGKTGTAEIKKSQEDQTGTELGWFNVFTAGGDVENPLLIISMVEDVKGRGGAGYVIPKVKSIFKAFK